MCNDKDRIIEQNFKFYNLGCEMYDLSQLQIDFLPITTHNLELKC